VWLALPQAISIRNSVFLSAKPHSANGYAHPPTATSVFHVSQQIDMAGEHLLCPAHSSGTSCRLPHEPLEPTNNKLLQTSTERISVSLRGRHAVDHSTSEEVSYVGQGVYSKVYNININISQNNWCTSVFLTLGRLSGQPSATVWRCGRLPPDVVKKKWCILHNLQQHS